MRTRVVLLGVFAVACTTPPAPDDAAVGIDAAEAADTNVQRRDAAIAPPPMTEAPLKGPFVMQPTTTSVVIRWESVLAPAHVEIDYAPQAGGTMRTANGTATLTHVLLDYRPGGTITSEPDFPGDYYVSEVAVTGLAPATCYTYFIAGYPADRGRFCTMHTATDHTTPITIYAIGDTSPAVQSTLRILAHTNPAGEEFTIHVGDLQYYSTFIESQQLWFDLMQPLLRANAFMPCEGNHESERPICPHCAGSELDDIYGRLFDHPGDRAGAPSSDTTWWYHYQSGGVHFISLSTERDITMGSPQWRWFDATMTRIEAEPGYRFTIVYFHRPIYGVASYAPNLANRAGIEAVITHHRVPLVLAGHMHNYERFQIGSITHVTTGSGGFRDLPETLTQNAAAFPADAARRVASGAYFEAMVIEITPDPMVVGGDLIGARVLDDLGMPRDTFEIHVPAR